MSTVAQNAPKLWEIRLHQKAAILEDALEKEKIPFQSQDLISNSPDCPSYNSYDISLENLVLDQLTIR